MLTVTRNGCFAVLITVFAAALVPCRAKAATPGQAPQLGFLYNLTTGQYTFLDDPAEAFNNGVEVTPRPPLSIQW